MNCLFPIGRNTGCVNIEPRQGSFVSERLSLQSFVLSAFPRWDKETILRVRPSRGAASKEAAHGAGSGAFRLSDPWAKTDYQGRPNHH